MDKICNPTQSTYYAGLIDSFFRFRIKKTQVEAGKSKDKYTKLVTTSRYKQKWCVVICTQHSHGSFSMQKQPQGKKKTLLKVTTVHELKLKRKMKTTRRNSIRDARTPQPGEIFFNTMRYRSSVTVQSSRYFQSSVNYIKVKSRSDHDSPPPPPPPPPTNVPAKYELPTPYGF